MRLLLLAVMIVLAVPASAQAALVDINGAHTTNSLGECHPDDGKTCTWIVSQWTPEGGSGAVLPFRERGTITRLKIPFTGPATAWFRIVRKTRSDAPQHFRYRVVRSTGPFRVKKGWLNTRARIPVRRGDTVAIGLRGENGPYVVYSEGGHDVNGTGGLLYGKRNSASQLGPMDHLCCGGEELDGLSMVLTVR